MTNETKLTITLTDRPPVKITKADWPILASAEEREHDGQYEHQANRRSEWRLIVRQHADGRAIVYGIFSHDTQWQGERDLDIRGGEMLPEGADIPAAIRRVAAALEARLPNSQHWSEGRFSQLAHECTADLPAIEV